MNKNRNTPKINSEYIKPLSSINSYAVRPSIDEIERLKASNNILSNVTTINPITITKNSNKHPKNSHTHIIKKSTPQPQSPQKLNLLVKTQES